MTQTGAIVFAKEVIDNFRDHRTLFSALVFGPLFGPALFAVLITIMLNEAVDSFDETVTIPVIGTDNAPNLIEFLKRSNLEISNGPSSLAQARDSVANGKVDAVLVIEASYPEQFAAGQPARLLLVVDQANNSAQKTVSRVRGALSAYGQELTALRMAARGVNPSVLRPLVVDTDDVSTPTGRSVLILGMMTYFLLFAMLMGGLYLAIDTTAGERERNSLEPLLALPVRRRNLLFGKLAATVFYMLLSLILTLTTFAIAIQFVPLERLGMSASFGPTTVLLAFVILAPFSLLGGGLMTVVASFTKSYKEAQSYLTVVLLVPTLPILFASLFQVKPTLSLMWVPSLSQHLLITGLIKGEGLIGAHLGVSAFSTLSMGAAVSLGAAALYRREGLLG